MANLRLLDINVLDSRNISAKFSESLDPYLNKSCITIKSNKSGVPDLMVVSISVSNEYVFINTSPMTPYVSYTVIFNSNDVFKFKSKSGTSFILNDGVTNCPKILGAEDPANPIREFLLYLLKDNVYSLKQGDLSRTIIDSQANELAKVLYSIKELKNDNYLSVDVIDELKSRGFGPWDRLNEEGAYEISRVGLTPSGEYNAMSINVTEFPSTPLTLLATNITNEILQPGIGPGTFNGLLFSVKNNFVTKLTKLKISYSSGGTAEYDIEAFGYQISNPRYDDYAFAYYVLENNQIKLSDDVLDSSFVLPIQGDTVSISYEYENKGRVIDATSVSVSKVLESVREPVKPIVSEFYLKNAPIVSSSDIMPTNGGVQFLDPESDPPFSTTHPAFVKEIVFSYDILPSRPGEYTIDYETGRVFVYGINKDGTGPIPPVASYYYRKSFSSRLDYTYDPSTSELSTNPLRDLRGQSGKINFNYEQVLVPNVDYKGDVHKEVINERVESRLQSLSSLDVLNTPITNVFRIYNETSGEIYQTTRWNDSTIYFSSDTPPRIVAENRERVSFVNIINELLVTNSYFTNTLSTVVLKIKLANDNIGSASEDGLGSSFNSSASFSKTDLFSKELYYDRYFSTYQQNTNKLNPGQYQIDYINGIVYLGVSTMTYDIGTINYNKTTIKPNNPHVISVSELYNSISISNGINKTINYSEFSDGEVVPSEIDVSDERFLNEDTTIPYIVDADSIVVSDNIKEVRGIYDADDLVNNIEPTDFSIGCDISGSTIMLASNGVQKKEVIELVSTSYVDVTSISLGAEICDVDSIAIVGSSMSINVTGYSNYRIYLGSGSHSIGDEVLVIYNVKLNGTATPVVDYSRGDYFIDYTYLADEILVSYEYGDNAIDFRESTSVSEGQQYYVTYKVGALREALLNNFGTLVNIPILNSFDISMPRESYRESLIAALQSFTKGPTIQSMTQLVSTITHIDPEIIESAFLGWYLGISRLYPQDINYTGNLKLLKSKFDDGILFSEKGDSVTFPLSNNFRLDEGTLELWVTPEWDGLDNDATITFRLLKNGTTLTANEIFIGASSYHPTLEDGAFSLNRTSDDSPIGIPSASFTGTPGVFVYYNDIDKLWRIITKDVTSSIYSGTIESSGEVYHVHSLGAKDVNDIIRSSSNKIEFSFNIDGYDSFDGYSLSSDGIGFMADENHYIFDAGKSDTRNRISLYKDGKGYLNFRVFDDFLDGKIGERKVSADISNWKAGERHHVAMSWELNSSDRKDEMHLFVDGFEVPNILKFGGRPEGTTTDRFRTVVPEVVVGTTPKDTIAGNDLATNVGSDIVTSAINFSSYGLTVGDSIVINEVGFGSYTIASINGNSLQLNTVMPYTLSNAKFSINQYFVVVDSAIDLYSNIAVSIIRGSDEIEIPGLRADVPSYAVSKNLLNQNVLTILGSALAGDVVVIRTLGLNHRRYRDRKYVWGNATSILRTKLPPPINLDEVSITSVTMPMMHVGPDNASLSGGIFTSVFTDFTQPSNSVEGRSLSVRINGNNVDFSTDVNVSINGYGSGGAASEILSFNAVKTLYTTTKFTSITSITAEVKPKNILKNSISLEVKEKYSITYSEGNSLYPVIRFSYQSQNGNTLSGAGSNIVTDLDNAFAPSVVGQVITLITPVAGTYTIIERIDAHNLKLSSAVSAFSGETYNIFNVAISRSGFQNGFFVLQQAAKVNTPFILPQGYYEFDYSAYLTIPMAPMSGVTAYLGSDFNNENQAKAILDEFRILSTKLTDVRIGESVDANTDYITVDASTIKKFSPSYETLMLLHLDQLPLNNDSNYWVTSEKQFIQSSTSVNDNFGKSIVITDTPLVIDNIGKFYTQSEGGVEFWVSPKYDTANDPNIRFYFDASGSEVEEANSLSSSIVKVKGKISKVISITLSSDDGSGINYYAGGSIESDKQTINLGKALPYQNVSVKIHYIPLGLSGNRFSIYKDTTGYLCFNVTGIKNNALIDYVVRQPIFWQRDTWHRVKVTYKFNQPDNKDEIRLFVDGEERGNILYGTGLIYGTGAVYGQGYVGDEASSLIGDINFTDTINEFFIGSDFFKDNTAYARVDNLRISNASRVIYSIAGVAKDINYSSNTKMALPVIEDLFTTYLLDFNTLVSKEDEFTLLKDEAYGIFNFALNIIDSFDIVLSNDKIKQVLEILIKTLKPAQSKVDIKYFQ